MKIFTTRRHLLTLAIGLFTASTIFIAAPTQAQESDKTYRIGFHLWKPGKIYDEAMEGIMDGLKLKGIKFETVILESDRNKELAEANLKKLDAMGLDLVYSLSSAGTKIANKIAMKTPVIATVINHPSSLGVSQDDGRDGTPLTGTSYYVEAEKQLALYRDLFPEVSSIGMIFDSNNPAGRLAEEPYMRAAVEAAGLSFASVGITEKEQITDAAMELTNAGVNMIVVPTNRLIYGNLDLVMAVTNDKHVPVLSMNKQGVENGAIAGLFADTYNLGRMTADIAELILKENAHADDIGFRFIADPDVILNLTSAVSLEYEFPAEVLSDASIIMQ